MVAYDSGQGQAALGSGVLLRDVEHSGLETSFGQGTGPSHQAAVDLAFVRINVRSGKSTCSFSTQQATGRLASNKEWCA